MSQTSYYSNGKLLITAEYLVLDGAKALAIPTMYGQDLKVNIVDKKGLTWVSKNEKDAIWFEADFQIHPKLAIQSTSDQKIAKTLLNIIQAAININHTFLNNVPGFQVSTHMNFPKEWGLGSSSTLINNIAQWASVNPFELLNNSFRGSGYDIACAQADSALIYSNIVKPPQIEKAVLNWPFTEDLYFVHLNKKQDSKLGIAHYNKITGNKNSFIQKVNQLTEEFKNCTTLTQFEFLIDTHEALLAGLLKMPKVKESLFPDYKGSIKSLGAWGGDFVLATRKDALSYFANKGFKTVIPFKEMIK